MGCFVERTTNDWIQIDSIETLDAFAQLITASSVEWMGANRLWSTFVRIAPYGAWLHPSLGTRDTDNHCANWDSERSVSTCRNGQHNANAHICPFKCDPAWLL